MIRGTLIGSLLLFSFFSFCQNPALEQKDSDPQDLVNPQSPNWVVKTNPLRYFWGALPFTSEYRLNVETVRSRYQSTELGISYLGESPILKTAVDSFNSQLNGNYGKIDIQVRGARLQLTHKFYIKGLNPGLTISSYAPNGYYIAPHASVGYAEFSVNDAPVPFMEMTHMNINLLFGRQMFFWNSIAFDAFIGGGYKKNIWVERNPNNHNANMVDPDAMWLYGGNFRFVLGFHIGLPF